MTDASIYTRLLEEWEDVLRRRPTFREPLTGYRAILEGWARWPGAGVRPLGWSAAECRARWERGVPLLAEVVPPLDPDEIEDLLVPALEFVLGAGREDEAVRRFAQAWDRSEVGPSALIPAKGSIGSTVAREAVGLSAETFGFLACVGLRPPLEAYLAPMREHLADGIWSLGVCPFCGSPPGFTDLLENGARRLACHGCGSTWIFPRLRCPMCGSEDSKHFIKLQSEGAEEGYLMCVCKGCNGYLKELDRRVRWNAASALVEDWASPHLDLVAHRSGYWRPTPTVMEFGSPRLPDGAR